MKNILVSQDTTYHKHGTAVQGADIVHQQSLLLKKVIIIIITKVTFNERTSFS